MVRQTPGLVVHNPKARLHKRRASYMYETYGVYLKSYRPLLLPQTHGRETGLAAVELSDGMTTLFRQVSRKAMEQSRNENWFRCIRLSDGSEYLRWSGLFEFLVSADGRRIVCHRLNRASDDAFQTYLLGQVLSFALLKHGIEPLHSTTVVINDEAVAFLGDCGYGKSSLGAAFLQAGHSLLTDDLLVVKEEENRFLAYPGPPRIKLFPKIARSLLGKRVNGTPMNHQTPKLVIPLSENETVSPRGVVPLRAIYVIKPPSARSSSHNISFRALSSRRACVELLRNTFNTVVIEPQRLKRQFDLATRLAARVPVKILSYPREISRISEVRESILREVAG